MDPESPTDPLIVKENDIFHLIQTVQERLSALKEWIERHLNAQRRYEYYREELIKKVNEENRNGPMIVHLKEQKEKYVNKLRETTRMLRKKRNSLRRYMVRWKTVLEPYVEYQMASYLLKIVECQMPPKVEVLIFEFEPKPEDPEAIPIKEYTFEPKLVHTVDVESKLDETAMITVQPKPKGSVESKLNETTVITVQPKARGSVESKSNEAAVITVQPKSRGFGYSKTKGIVKLKSKGSVPAKL